MLLLYYYYYYCMIVLLLKTTTPQSSFSTRMCWTFNSVENLPYPVLFISDSLKVLGPGGHMKELPKKTQTVKGRKHFNTLFWLPLIASELNLLQHVIGGTSRTITIMLRTTRTRATRQLTEMATGKTPLAVTDDNIHYGLFTFLFLRKLRTTTLGG